MDTALLEVSDGPRELEMMEICAFKTRVSFVTRARVR